MTVSKTIALVFGIVYLLIGLLGFLTVPTSGNLLGIFTVDTMHNLVHVVVGILGIAVAFLNYTYTRLYFQVFGIVFLLLTILGFVTAPNGGMVLGMAMNMPDHVLHLITAVLLLYFGFVYNEAEQPGRAGMA